MYLRVYSFLLLLLPFCLKAQELPRVNPDIPRPSPMAMVVQRVGITDVSITYSRPAVKGREIWGKLVPFGYTGIAADRSRSAPWRAGANETTLFTTTDDLLVEGELLKKGKYGLFIAPLEGGTADVIFTTNYQAWGGFDYDPEKVALKVNVSRLESADMVEDMTFLFSSLARDESRVELLWADEKIAFGIKVDTNEITYQKLLANQNSSPALSGATTGGWSQAAALFCMNNNIHFDQALKWSTTAINPNVGRRTFVTLTTHANLQFLNGNEEAGMKVLEEAFDTNPGSGFYSFYGTQATGFKAYAYAMATYEKLIEKFPELEHLARSGQAETYFAQQKFEEAIKHLDKAIALTPVEDETTKSGYKLRKNQMLAEMKN